MNNTILLIANSKQMAIEAEKISHETNFYLDIKYGNIENIGYFYEDMKLIENIDYTMYDVIISQGDTANRVRQLTNIPVLSVELTTNSLLSALFEAQKFESKIGILFYEPIKLEKLYNVKNIFNIDFELYPYLNPDELKFQINNALFKDVKTIVGVGDCLEGELHKQNINYITIDATRDNIRRTILEANNILEQRKKEKEKATVYNKIVNYSRDGIITIDNNLKITAINPTAEKIFNVNYKDVIKKSVKKTLKPGLYEIFIGNDNVNLNKPVEINKNRFLMNKLSKRIDGEIMSTVFIFQYIHGRSNIINYRSYNKGLVAKYSFDNIKGNSKKIKNALKNAKIISRTNTTVLITGETGTGKELFAQGIHTNSSRKNWPFVAVNCASIPKQLIESELFGYNQGAFTDAKKGGKPGFFEIADNGTIFLDEISEIPYDLQGKLLRVLQEKEIRRIGSESFFKVDVRIIAATNVNLKTMVEQGKFRKDLYYRLNILELEIPPLRDRICDIPILFEFMIKKANSTYDTSIEKFTNDAINYLQDYDWPGNVRELENLVEKIAVFHDQKIIDKSIVSKFLLHKNSVSENHTCNNSINSNDSQIVLQIDNLKNMESQIIYQVYKKHMGNKSDLANILGISRTTLWKRMKEIEMR